LALIDLFPTLKVHSSRRSHISVRGLPCIQPDRNNCKQSQQVARSIMAFCLPKSLSCHLFEGTSPLPPAREFGFTASKAPSPDLSVGIPLSYMPREDTETIRQHSDRVLHHKDNSHGFERARTIILGPGTGIEHRRRSSWNKILNKMRKTKGRLDSAGSFASGLRQASIGDQKNPECIFPSKALVPSVFFNDPFLIPCIVQSLHLSAIRRITSISA